MRLPVVLVVVMLLAGVAAAPASARAPLGLDECRASEGLRQCSGLVTTFDGVPLDTTVTLPAAAEGRLPLVVNVHGFGNSKSEYLDPASRAYTDNAYGWARAGYAVLTYTARGLWGSCGSPEARLAHPSECARGYIHLADTRYEVRDTQELIGRLVDDGTADPARIGVTGDSYGGGQTMALAALADRVMLEDGRLVPWRSPAGVPLRLAAAAPVIPWTDLVAAIAPNGRPVSDRVVPTGAGARPVGMFKASVANAIFAAAQFAIGPGQPVGEPFVPGRPMGYLAPPGTDPRADVSSWVARADAGEPYSDRYIRGVIADLTRHHSAYGIDPSSPPPPLLVGSGFTDDIFGVDEVLRFVNRLRRDHPGTPVSLLLGDFGHQRAANKPADRERLLTTIHAWFDHHVRGDGPAPPRGVTVTTQTCPRDVASEGPFTASSFSRLAESRVRLRRRGARVVRPLSGDPQTARAIDPAAGGGDGCVAVGATPAPGTAVYRLRPAPAGGTLLLGAPLVRARLRVAGNPATAGFAARLWDVAPDGRTQRLVTRALVRPTGARRQTFELRPAAWRFAEGHVAKLELLGADAPYGRPPNLPRPIAVSDLTLTLPVR